MTDPYKEVWDNVERHEPDLNEAANNGTLFAPSYETMGIRSASTARHLLRQARAFGPGTQGREAFEEALFHVELARMMFTERDKVNRLSR